MVSMDKQYRTRGGRKVRIYAVDGGGRYPIHGAFYREELETWILCCWTELGLTNNHGALCDDMLVEVKPRIQRVYEWSPPHHVTHIKITVDVEEGEGL